MKHNRILMLVAAGLLVLASVPSAVADVIPEEASKLFKEAQALAKAQKFDEAIAVMKKVIQISPRNDLALATLSDYELKANKYTDGMDHALQAIKLNDKVGPYYVLVAGNALGNHDLDRTREYSELVLKRGPKEFGAGACSMAQTLLDSVTPRTYSLFWKLDPQKGRREGATLAVALPKNDLPYQTVTYEISGVQSHRLVKGEANDILYVVPQGTKPFSLTTKITVKPYTYKQALAKATPKPLPQDVRVYLGAGESINPQSPALMKVVSQLKGSNNADTARNILAWMKKNIDYKLQKSSIIELDFKSVDEIVERGHAECRGYAMLFVALCRAAGIPARPVWGFTRVPVGTDPQASDLASHNWAEFYVPGCGWVPIDPQRLETLGFLPTTCIRIFMDAKKSKMSAENLPMLNLVFMNGEKLKFEESR